MPTLDETAILANIAAGAARKRAEGKSITQAEKLWISALTDKRFCKVYQTALNIAPAYVAWKKSDQLSSSETIITAGDLSNDDAADYRIAITQKEAGIIIGCAHFHLDEAQKVAGMILDIAREMREKRDAPQPDDDPPAAVAAPVDPTSMSDEEVENFLKALFSGEGKEAA